MTVAKPPKPGPKRDPWHPWGNKPPKGGNNPPPKDPFHPWDPPKGGNGPRTPKGWKSPTNPWSGGKKPKDNEGGGSKPKGKGGKHKGGGGKGRYGAYAGYKGVKRSRAKGLVDAEINPLIRDVAREIHHARQQAQRSRGDIQHVFNESGKYINSQNQKVDQAFQGFNQNQEAARAALMGQMQSQGNQAARGALSELQRLGLGSQFLGQMAADQQNAQNMANQQMAHTRENADLMHLGANSMGHSLAGMNAGEKASNLGQIANTRDTAIFDLRRDKRDLNQQRPELMRQMLEQMAAQGWGQYVDQRNLNQNQQALNLQKQGQAFAQRQAGSSQASQNAYNSTLSSLYQQQLANTYPNRRP